MIRKFIVLVAVFLIIGVVYGLGRQIYDSLQSGRRLDIAASEVAELQKKNSELKNKLQDAEGIGFVEAQVRDKLNLSRPNETVVVIPQSDIDLVLGESKHVEGVKLPNWQGWLKLFWR